MADKSKGWGEHTELCLSRGGHCYTKTFSFPVQKIQEEGYDKLPFIAEGIRFRETEKLPRMTQPVSGPSMSSTWCPLLLKLTPSLPRSGSVCTSLGLRKIAVPAGPSPTQGLQS